MNKVLLVESAAEAEQVIKCTSAVGPDLSRYLIVALDPEGRSVFGRYGIDCLDTLPFFDNASHARAAHGTAGIENLIWRAFDLNLRDGLERTYRNRCTFLVLFWMRAAIFAIEVLDRVRSLYPQVGTVACCGPAASEGLAQLCRDYCSARGLALEQLVPEGCATRRAPERRAASLLAQVGRRFLTFAYSAVARSLADRGPLLFASAGSRIEGIAKSLGEQHPGRPLAFLRYEPFGLGEELARAAFWLVHLLSRQASDKILTIPVDQIGLQIGKAAHAQAREAISQATASLLTRHAGEFQYAGVPLAASLMTRRERITTLMCSYHEVGLAEARLLALMRPRLVISPSAGQVYHVLGELCRREGIPGIVVPMKTLTAPQTDLEAMGQAEIGQDMLTDAYAYAVAQSAQALDYARHAAYPGRVIESGPLMRSLVTQRQREDCRARFFAGERTPGPVIVYAPSMKPAAPFHVVHTLDEVICSMQDLVVALEQLPAAHLVLRLHPNLSRLAPALANLLCLTPRVHVDVGSYDSIVDSLGLADVLVSDMSTVAEEAIANRIPALLYDRWGRYNHLKAPAVVAGEPEQLSPAYYLPCKTGLTSTLRWILANHRVGLSFPQEQVDKYVYADSRNASFYEFVDGLLRDAPAAAADGI
ncbi:MAG: hypothetical protein GX557_05330 [Chloroflexi bacterium]|nr:hypothetical protein [Chloroflexota bacterium]